MPLGLVRRPAHDDPDVSIDGIRTERKLVGIGASSQVGGDGLAHQRRERHPLAPRPELQLAIERLRESQIGGDFRHCGTTILR